VDLKISWSGIRTYEECKQKRHLQMQRKELKTANQRVFFPGTVTDRVVRDYLNANGDMNMPAKVSDIMDREQKIIEDDGGFMQWKDTSDRKRVEADCIEAVTKIEPALVKLVLPFKYQADYGFKAPLKLPHPDGGKDTAILNGFIDVIVQDDDGEFHVYDVKHTKDNSYWRKTSAQLSFYDLSIRITEGKYTKSVGLLQPLCDEEVKMIPLDDMSRTSIIQRISAMATDTWKGDFTPRVDNKICGMCNVRHACSKFTPVLDSKGKSRISF
jgi:CRISPR/Cas system-associated exonuclease Cas4 (RecB family)